jgi:hypothetical protein
LDDAAVFKRERRKRYAHGAPTRARGLLDAHYHFSAAPHSP